MKLFSKNITIPEIIKNPILRLKGLSGRYSNTLLRVFVKNYLYLAKLIPGADVIFLGIFLKEIKILFTPLNLSNNCGPMFLSFVYDVFVFYFIVTGFVIYLTRRYILSRK